MSLERIKRGLPLFLGDFLTLLLLLAGGIFSYFTPYELELGAAPLLAVCALAALASTAIWSLPAGKCYLPAFGLLAGSAFAFWWDYTAQGNAVPPPGLLDYLLERPLAMALLTTLLALLLGWAAVRVRCWYLAALAVTVPVLPAITGGVLPDWSALTAATLGWGTMLLTSLYDQRDRASLGKGVLISMAGLAALLLGLTAALPREGYERPQWATNTRNSLINSISAAVRGGWDREVPEFLEGYLYIDGGESFGGGGSTAGSGGYRIPVTAVTYTAGAYVDLRSAGPRRYVGNTVLEIQGGESGWNYLWGGSAGTYTGSTWEDIDQSALSALWDALKENLIGVVVEPTLLPAMTAPDTMASVMTIRHAYSGGTMAYYPYRPVYFSTEGVELRSALTVGMNVPGEARAVKDRRVQEYQVAYRPGGPADGFTPLSGGAAVVESAYRGFVYENYLTVPWEARSALSPLLSRTSAVYSDFLPDIPEQWREASRAAQRAASVLHETAEYDLNTPAMEAGEDFVAQFLSEGRGYCVHFATAGALLLRMQGIPARYVSGYAFRTDDTGAADVKDSAAHAWVEIYLDGYGWYPMEMTPGYSGGLAAPDGTYIEEAEILTPTETDDPVTDVDEPDEPGAPDKPEAPVPPETPEQDEEVQAPDATTSPETPEEKGPLDLSWLRLLVVLLLAAAVPVAMTLFGTHLRRQSRERPDTNRSVIEAYVRYRRLLAWGGEELPELEALAQKAKFSQHELTAEERETAWKHMEDTGRRLEGRLPWWKRAAFRCFRPLF